MPQKSDCSTFEGLHETHQLRAEHSAGIACIAAVAQTNAPVAGLSVPGLEAFDEMMLATLAKNDYPGGSLAVSYQGRMVLSKTYGFAKKGLTGNTPMPAEQRMRIASMSKWITAVAALKAAEQGKLNLDQPVAEILAWSQKPADYTDARALKITTRQLLQNHAGWTIDRSNDPMFERAPACPASAERWVSRQKLDADPGQHYSYSNINFCIAQLALEKATGQSYADFVKSTIAQPLGITSWQIASLRGSADEPEYASSQGQDSNPYTNLNFDALGAAGAWVSSSSDYVRFLSGIRGSSGVSLLKPDSVAQLITRPSTPDGATKPTYYGLGTNVRALDAGLVPIVLTRQGTHCSGGEVLDRKSVV